MSQVAHHFDDAEQQLDAATMGMWLFLATEILFFGGLFLGYFVYRSSYPEAFAEGARQLSVTVGTINTAILLCSSLTMALAVRSAQTNDRRKTVAFLIATIILGTAFLGVKAFEYAGKFEHHLVPGQHFHLEPGDPTVQPEHVELYFGFYFGMTGMHALHMIIGAVVLAIMVGLAHRSHFSSESYTKIEMTGLYWHFVDIVWVFLFPLMYLIG